MFRIESPRLVLDRFDGSRLDLLKIWTTDADMMHYQGGVMTAEECEGFAARIQEHWERYGFGYHVALLKDALEPIGFFSLKYLSDEDAAKKIPNLGFALVPGVRGRGFATEGTGVLLDFARTELHFSTVFAFNDPENLASARVLEKSGFEAIGNENVAAYGRGSVAAVKWEIRL